MSVVSKAEVTEVLWCLLCLSTFTNINSLNSCLRTKSVHPYCWRMSLLCLWIGREYQDHWMFSEIRQCSRNSWWGLQWIKITFAQIISALKLGSSPWMEEFKLSFFTTNMPLALINYSTREPMFPWVLWCIM